MTLHIHPQFWQDLEQLVATSELVIDRPKGQPHPRFVELIYPFDYGYLATTSGGDGSGIDVWVGSGSKTITGLLATVDVSKRDSETKILLGCSANERQEIWRWLNDVAELHCILIEREHP
jgi:inorganic pyrophosphatase